VDVPRRAYIVPLDLDVDYAHDAIIAIAEDFADGNVIRECTRAASSSFARRVTQPSTRGSLTP
jgi:hypothetical protein